MDGITSDREGLLESSEEGLGPRGVTVSLRQKVPKANQAGYEIWQQGILNANKVMPGFLGATIVKETQESDSYTIFLVIIKYDSVANANAWNKSATRKEWIDKLQDSTGEIHTGRAVLSFDEYPSFIDVFRPDSDPKHTWWSNFFEKRRLWFLIFFQVYVLVVVYNWLIPAVFGQHWMSLHFQLQIFLSVLLTTLTIDLLTMDVTMATAKMVGFIRLES
jgi:antibiotic biosynthesis monooxygenase (ABM) superfamily enzyme